MVNEFSLRKLPGKALVRDNARFSPAPLPPEPQPDVLPEQGQDPEWEELVGALRLHRRQLLRMPGVIAVDVGYKIKEEGFTNTLALRVHVERKLPDKYFVDHPNEYLARSEEADRAKKASKGKALRDSDLDPKPKVFRGPSGKPITIDIIHADYQPAALPVLPQPSMVLETPLGSIVDQNRRRRIDPLIGGLSVGNPHTPVGTLGALVWDKTDGSVCILSNWHVLAGHMHAAPGTPCFQPGPFDRGRSCDIVARLKRWSFDCQTDAAIAELTGSRHYCAGEIVGLSRQISGETPPYLGMIVLKSGRSTGKTWGFVDGLYFSSAIRYSNGVVQVFEDQIHIAPLNPNQRISEPGDSGSVWVTDANGDGYLAVGLHFAGDLLRSAFGEFAIANPMTVVARNLDISFRPVFLEIRDEAVNSLPLTFGTELGNGGRPIGIQGGGLTDGGPQGDPVISDGGGTTRPTR